MIDDSNANDYDYQYYYGVKHLSMPEGTMCAVTAAQDYEGHIDYDYANHISSSYLF